MEKPEERENINSPGKPSPFRKACMKIIVSAITIYCIIAFLLTILQRRIIYYPYKLDKRYEFPPFVPGMREVFIECADGKTINGLYSPGSDEKPVILMFHGNAGNIIHREFLIKGFHRLGYSTLITDFHGYGKSEGSPSEHAFYLDGEAAVSWLDSEIGTKPENIVVFAKSIGSGVGCELAVRHQVKGLILETPFASTSAVASSHFPYNLLPTSLLILDKFANIKKINRVNTPLLFIHGTRDRIVPCKNSKRLFEKAEEPKELYLIEGAGHNNVQDKGGKEYWEKVDSWIRGLEQYRQK